MDVLSRSYDSDQLNALFADEEDLRNNRLENLGMTQTTPPMENMQAIEDETTIQRIFELVKNGQFVLLTLAISSLYFVVTGLQYWISAYLMITMQIE